jgi:hypothetical protein
VQGQNYWEKVFRGRLFAPEAKISEPLYGKSFIPTVFFLQKIKAGFLKHYLIIQQ